MTPIERACVAIIEALRAQGNLCDDCGEPEYAQVEGSFEVEPVARAVLQAIREPSGGMKSSTWIKLGDYSISTEDQRALAAADVWRAMIDAALEER